MQLGLYRTTLAAHRLSSVFKVSLFGKMANRGIGSRPEANSVNSRKNVTDNKQEQPQLWSTSSDAYEKEFPTLSAASSVPKSKRGTGMDLGTSGEQSSEKEVKNIGPPKLKASTSISQDNDTQLPTSFGKKRAPSPSRNQKLRQNYREAKGSPVSTPSPRTAIDEPFDICLRETRESSPPRISGNEENHGMSDQKVQSAEGNQQHKDNAGRNDNKLHSIEEIGQVLRPGMVLLKHYISMSEQVDIVNRCRTLGCGPGGFYRPGFDDGAKLHLHMMCLGLDWNAQTRSYGERRRHDNVVTPQIPNEFTEFVCRALDDSHTLIKRELKTINVKDILPSMSPDVCIVNFYNTTGRLGLHQDRDESWESLEKGLPVVSISVGDSAEFLFGDQRNVDKATQVVIESGDVLIFGGESRHIFHGVKTIIPNTAPAALLESTKLKPGRLNLTFRKF